jgi:hypothetical protein
VSPITFGICYLFVGLAVIPLVFSFFKTQFSFIDVLIATVPAAVVVMFVPSPYGGTASLAVHIGLFYWRFRRDLVPDIVVAVGAARLTMVPIALSLQYHGVH